jgi:hypothetical protein
MPARKSTGIHTGNIEAGIANIGGNQTLSGPVILNINSQLGNTLQKIDSLNSASTEDKEALTGLVNQLKEALAKAPAANADDAEKVARRVDAMVEEAAAPKPDREMLQITGESLKKAAKNIAGVMPIVLTIATQIVQHILRFGG